MTPSSRLLPLPRESRGWLVAAILLFVLLAVLLSGRLNAPFDFNGAVWAQSARNNLRASLAVTYGVPSGFYFGPLPIPAGGYYTHHPPGLPLLLTALFAVTGPREWVARLVPITASLLTAILLFRLVYACSGRIRAATLTLAVLTILPMELTNAMMVNHEPMALLAMLGMLTGLRLDATERPVVSRAWLFASLIFGLLMAWHVYMFAALVGGWLIIRGPAPARRTGIALIAISIGALVLFFLHIHLVRPDAWQDLVNQFRLRLSLQSERAVITWASWGQRVFGEFLFQNISPRTWFLAIVGSGVLLAQAPAAAGMRRLAGSCLAIFVLNAFYVVCFRNASYVHDYAAFYFVVPVAVTAALGLEWLGTRPGLVTGRVLRLGAVVVFIALGWWGIGTSWRNNQAVYPVLSWDPGHSESPALIPELGRLIGEHFPPDQAVLCNFLPIYGPHLHYYAQRTILNYLTTADHWREALANPASSSGGVIWRDEPSAHELLAGLPPGSCDMRDIAGERFCFWKPAPRGSDQ